MWFKIQRLGKHYLGKCNGFSYLYLQTTSSLAITVDAQLNNWTKIWWFNNLLTFCFNVLEVSIRDIKRCIWCLMWLSKYSNCHFSGFQHIKVVDSSVKTTVDNNPEYREGIGRHKRMSKSTHDQLSDIFRKIGIKNESSEVMFVPWIVY